ncbi:hypothetical protein ACHHYP_03222 [Achlya hypogyna]|uniref:Histidine kinase/HSP90-like ATPase domain-containing protein n=1 Tax=Achlya hypogyna TaxID=1202772 RepID=A0A1V9Z4B8_ACHHY|nr:hypothetical protein ACHHYP_03222 [Achlya hypogyna]
MSVVQPASARFLRDNLEVLGFGSAQSALVQVVKELFENALDAVQDAGMIVVRLTTDGDCIEVVCTDTGFGMHVNNIAQLCCGVFASTKTSATFTAGKVGKFGTHVTQGVLGHAWAAIGVGLKAALLYSQQHVDDARGGLKITTTLDSHEVYFSKLLIDADAPADSTSIVQSSQQFAISEEHQPFSGTEVRLHLPCPDSASLADALSTLHAYFVALRYTIGSSLSVELVCDLPTPLHVLHPNSPMNPLDRLLHDHDCNYADIAHVDMDFPGYHVNLVALLQPTPAHGLRAHLYRYVNHVPLLPDASCTITATVFGSGSWKRLGYRCTPAGSTACALHRTSDAPATDDGGCELVVAVDLSATGGPVKYRSLTKTGVDECYASGLRASFAAALDRLRALAPARFTPLAEQRSQRVVAEYVPLIATALVAIATASDVAVDARHLAPGGLLQDVASAADLEARLASKMRQVLAASFEP